MDIVSNHAIANADSVLPVGQGLFKVIETTQYLGISRSFLDDLVARGVITPVVLGTNRRFRRVDLERILNGGEGSK